MQQKARLNIIQNYDITVDIKSNPFQFEVEDLFKMATRINKKRQFLFVSTLLGKHLAVRPQIPLLTGTLLAMMYYQRLVDREVPSLSSVVEAIKKQDGQPFVDGYLELPEETLFIGFAETATALGHAVFKTFQSNATYIHTTRELLLDIEPFITFEEEHSHATSHRIYSDAPEKLLQAKRIVLIDDEITTGNTTINIIQTLKEKFPHVQHYTVLSILDWRSEKQDAIFKQLERQWNISIDFIAIMRGSFSCDGAPILTDEQAQVMVEEAKNMELLSIEEPLVYQHYHSIAENGQKNRQPYMFATGRFMLTSEQQRQQQKSLQAIAQQIKTLRTDGPALVIGTGEFMYVPMEIAAYLGEDVYFQSTTRSPIYCSDAKSYTITQKLAFESPENNGVINYLYNVQNRPYTELFLLVERIANKEIVARVVRALQSVSNAKIYVICMHELEDEV
ncbi:phosphoribosyltransferase family protein [Bacillus ndiopicus]|uniref:phosphoribosyltransferase family protein n=1 Tax=Bacillus ndiopicus TaxID=1347368 RepID=UPI000694D86F|nr:phosphoribosyltransferase family protein [Bacillus ndiopicus]